MAATATSSYAPPTTLSSLREYVAGDSAGMQCAAESTVQLFVTHCHLKAKFPEIRLDKHMSVDAVKGKINSMTGTSTQTMVLHLQDPSGRLVAVLDEPAKKLGFYSPANGWVLHVLDSDATSLAAQGWLEDVSKVTKYEMSEEEYAARDNTYRRFKQERLRDDPGWSLDKEMAARKGLPYTPPPVVGPDYQAGEAAALTVGTRCCVEPGERRGEIKYVGRVEGLAEGWWVGVAFDEPLGKGDGSVKGRRLFVATPGHASFVRPDKVTPGAFPPLDDFSSDLASDDEI